MATNKVTIIKNNKINNWYSTINATEVHIINKAPKNRREYILFRIHETLASFTGRIKEILKIHYFLSTENKFVVTGLGGVGKSELIRTYSWKYKSYYNKNIVWIDAETENTLLKSFHCLAAELNIYTKTDTDDRYLQQVVQDIYRYFDGQMVLFIFDNVMSLNNIKSYFPVPEEDYKNIHILISSQNTEWGHIEKLVLDVLSKQDSFNFINNFLIKNCKLKENEESIKELASLLQNLPLAMQQAVSYITDKVNYEDDTYTIQNYIDEFKNEELLLNYTFNDEESPFPEYSDNIYNKTMFITVKLMTENIEKASIPFAKDILYITSYISADYIDRNIFLQLVDNIKTKLNVAIRVIVKYSLITSQDNYLFIHRLVQKVLRYKIRSENLEENILNKSLILLCEDYDNYDIHLISVLQYVANYEKMYLNFYHLECKNKTELLRIIARNNYYNIFKSILNTDNDFDLNNDELPLSVAFSGNVEMMKFIIEKGFNIYIKNEQCLKNALFNNSMELINYLLSQNFNLNKKDDSGRTILYFVVFNDNSQLLQDLLSKGADFNQENICLLATAIVNSCYNAAKVLVQNGIVSSLKLNKEYLIESLQNVESNINYNIKSDTDLMLHLIEFLEIGKLDIINYMTSVNSEINDTSTSTNQDHIRNMNALKFCLRNHKNKNNLLLIFAIGNKTELVKLLIEYGAEIDFKNNCGNTILYYAALNGSTAVCELLISMKANVHHINNYGESILHAAASNGHLDIVKILLDHKVNINLSSDFNFAATDYALMHNHLDVFEYLIKSGANVQNLYFGPLYLIIQQNRIDAILTVLKNGFKINNTSQNGYTLLHLATEENNLELIKILLDNEADINARGNKNETALSIAGHKGNLDTVKYLLENGAQPKSNSEKISALLSAGNYNNISLVEQILKQGIDAKIFRILYKGKTLLFSCLKNGFTDIFKHLVEYDLDCLQEIYEPGGYTLLHASCHFGHFEIVKFLISKGLSIEAITETKDTPLNIATMNGHYEIVKYLVKIGANIHCKNIENIFPLAFATIFNYLEIFNFLCENNSNIYEEDEEENSLLHCASMFGQINILKILTDTKIPINKQNKKGFTALHLAASKGHLEVVQHLISKGALVNIENDEHETCIMLAEKNGHTAIVEYLQ